ncbi:MAG: hypothetical protein U1B78_05850, partial [Dehalococcoidia bacterium]|nr:hypothetical protein [Dehalococcoidia bacterium]
MGTNTSSADPADPRVMSGQTWDDFCETLKQARKLVVDKGVPDSPRDRAEGLRYLTRLLAAGLVTCVEHADPDEPAFGRMVDYDMRWGLDCPDCLYLYATVRGDATYRISGHRGTANHIDIQVNFGHFASGDISAWGTVSSISGLDLQVATDGEFELLLGGAEREGNWLRLASNAEFVLVRQYFNDWERERPADLAIERLDAQGPAPPLRTDQIAARLERLSMWIERGGALWERMSRNALDLEPNSLIVTRPQDSDERAGLRGQAYGIGNFRCGPDEAVIVEFTPPACHHWSVSLANWYWESLDFASRQTSLNGHQAWLDDDGVFRGIIAHGDPGVPNWLDTFGHTQGTIAARFLLA